MPRRWLAPEFFTDEKMKKATIPERLLAAAIIANQDDDGRLRGDPAYLRAIAFLYDDYSLDEVRAMRDHLTRVNPNILVYENAGEEYIQLKRYQRYQKPRYYRPSKFPAPTGWPFEEEPLKNVYKGDVEKTIQYDIAGKLRRGEWQPTTEKITDIELNKRIGNLYADIVATTNHGYILIEIKQYPLQFRDLGQVLGYRAEMETRGYTPVKTFLIGNGAGNLNLKEAEDAAVTLLNLDLTPIVVLTNNHVASTKQVVKPTMVSTGKGEGKGLDLDLDLDKGKGEGEGRKPHPTPTPAASSKEILERLFHCHEKGWGMLPGAKISAQLRDLSEKLFAAHCPLDYIDQAFKEAAHLNKYSVSYVRAILLDWLGVERSPPG